MERLADSFQKSGENRPKTGKINGQSKVELIFALVLPISRDFGEKMAEIKKIEKMWLCAESALFSFQSISPKSLLAQTVKKVLNFE